MPFSWPGLQPAGQAALWGPQSLFHSANTGGSPRLETLGPPRVGSAGGQDEAKRKPWLLSRPQVLGSQFLISIMG